MIDQKIPAVPNDDIAVVEDARDSRFVQWWFRYFTDARAFMAAVRAAPVAVAQEDLAVFARRYGREQTGAQVWISAPFNHLLRFNGTAFDFAPGDAGSGYMVEFLMPPVAPGWVNCDGSTTTQLLPTGEVAEQVLPNTPSMYFRR